MNVKPNWISQIVDGLDDSRWTVWVICIVTLMAGLFVLSPQLQASVIQATIVIDGIGAEARLSKTVNRRVSANGRYVVYESVDASLRPDTTDENGESDIYLIDRQTGGVTLVSHASGNPDLASDNASDQASISADGNWVVFRSLSTNLVSGLVHDNTQFQADIYLFERLTGQLTLVSHALGDAMKTANGHSSNPGVSDDGAYTVFNSDASNLATQPDMNNQIDAFLFERQGLPDDNVLLISGVTETANGSSTDPIISGDGEWVVFASRGDNLITGVDSNGTDDVFLWERALAGTPAALRLISHRPGMPTTAGNGRSRNHHINRDGSAIAFDSSSDDLLGVPDDNGDDDIFLWQASTGELLLISHTGDGQTSANGSSSEPMLASDGSHVAFTSTADDVVAGIADTNDSEDVFRYTVATASNTLISHRIGNPMTTGSNSSINPRISDTGDAIAFLSNAPDLTTGADNNLSKDVFLWRSGGDGVTLMTHRQGVTERTSNGTSLDVELSGNGQSVVFDSSANNLISGSTEGLYHADSDASIVLLSQRSPLNQTGTGEDFVNDTQFGLRKVSDNGRWIVFSSSAPNLIAGTEEPLGFPQVYRLDLMTGDLMLVSHRPGEPLTGGNDFSRSAEISGDGQRVVFISRATDLAPNIPPGFIHQAYLYDAATDSVSLISHTSGDPSIAGNRDTTHARVSADGSHIVMQSRAFNLGPETDLNGQGFDLFLHDVSTGIVQRITNASTGESVDAQISSNGSRIAFISNASTLVTGIDTNGTDDAFIFNSDTLSTTLISFAHTSNTTAANGAASGVSISGDGRFVTYATRATDMRSIADSNGAEEDVFLYDEINGLLTLVSHAHGQLDVTADARSLNPDISRNGDAIVYESRATNLTAGAASNSIVDVFRYTLATGASTQLSLTPQGGNPDANSSQARVNQDGSVVVYQSAAQDITAEPDSNGNLPDVIRHDVMTGTNTLISQRFDGTSASNGTSDLASVSANGSLVMFRSNGIDLMRQIDNTDRFPGIFIHQTPSSAADLSLDIVPFSSVVEPGGLLRLDVAASNLMPSAAARMVVVLSLPSGTQLSGFAGTDWQCELAGSSLICPYGLPLSAQAPTLFLDLIMPTTPAPWTIEGSIKSLLQEQDLQDNRLQVIIRGLDIFDDSFESI